MKLEQLLNGRSPNESSSSVDSSHRIAEPTEFDVLFGRGKPFQAHKGNLRLHSIVDMFKLNYAYARRHKKTEVATEIVRMIKQDGEKAGRFLRRAKGDSSWVEVSDIVAREKVSHALRGKKIGSEDGSCSKAKSVRSREVKTPIKAAKNKLIQDSFAFLPLHAVSVTQSNKATFPFSTRGLPIEYHSQALKLIIAERERQLLQQLVGHRQHPGLQIHPQLTPMQDTSILLQALRSKSDNS